MKAVGQLGRIRIYNFYSYIENIYLQFIKGRAVTAINTPYCLFYNLIPKVLIVH